MTKKLFASCRLKIRSNVKSPVAHFTSTNFGDNHFLFVPSLSPVCPRYKWRQNAIYKPQMSFGDNGDNLFPLNTNAFLKKKKGRKRVMKPYHFYIYIFYYRYITAFLVFFFFSFLQILYHENHCPHCPQFFFAQQNGVMARFIAQKNGDNLFGTLSPVCPQFIPEFNFLHGRRLFVVLDMQDQL